MDHHFPKSFRLCRAGQFQNVFATRCSVADHAIILFAAPNDLPYCRLGLSVSKKIGNAVVRNRWKRLLREAFRTIRSELPEGFDLLVLPKRNVDVHSVRHLEQSLKKLVAKIRSRPTVLLTRAEHQVEPAKTELTALGYHVLLQPAIDILPPESWVETENALQKIRQGEFDWLLFSSSNGVHSFFEKVGNFLQVDIRIAAVGSGTDAALYQRLGRHADVVPDAFVAEGVADALLVEAKQGKQFLHLRASRGRETLKQLLTEAGGKVTEIAVYRSVDRTQPDPKIMKLMQQGEINYVTVTSSAIACSLVAMFGEELRQTSLISISPLTSQTLCELGFPPQYEAAEASMTGIVQALKNKVL